MVEKDIKNIAHSMERSGSFEDELERRKHAVLTALCDAVLTTSATFAVTDSDERADRTFKRPMVDELLTEYLKDDAEREKFLANVRRQFPEGDAAAGEGPKRMRVKFRTRPSEAGDAKQQAKGGGAKGGGVEGGGVA